MEGKGRLGLRTGAILSILLRHDMTIDNIYKFNPLIHNTQNGQAHFKNLAASAARFLNCAWPFWNIMYWKVKQTFTDSPFAIALGFMIFPRKTFFVEVNSVS